jgi:ethanolamine ammonia-lyase small subunit
MDELPMGPGAANGIRGVTGAEPLFEWARETTPARILNGRTGGSYRTKTQLELRADHAAARDAVTAGLDLRRDLGEEFVSQWGLFEVATLARSKQEYLLKPQLGRSLDPDARPILRERCPVGTDFQVAIGDGLSAAAVVAQVPRLLTQLHHEAELRGWRFGQPFFIRHCRVGILNDLGEQLDAAVVVLLIGERPGLATALSLSAYMAFRPRAGHDDSHRNLISNIHDRGVPPVTAARRIVRLADQMIRLGRSGVNLKEDSLTLEDGRRGDQVVPSQARSASED